MESRLANPVDFIKLQSLCVGEGITPDSGAVPLAPDSKDADSVSTGLSVRDFLETVAEKIRVEEAVYDKFFCALSDVLGQDASQVVLQEASYPVTADETANGHDTDTDASEVSSPLEDEGQCTCSIVATEAFLCIVLCMYHYVYATPHPVLLCVFYVVFFLFL